MFTHSLKLILQDRIISLDVVAEFYRQFRAILLKLFGVNPFELILYLPLLNLRFFS